MNISAIYQEAITPKEKREKDSLPDLVVNKDVQRFKGEWLKHPYTIDFLAYLRGLEKDELIIARENVGNVPVVTKHLIRSTLINEIYERINS